VGARGADGLGWRGPGRLFDCQLLHHFLRAFAIRLTDDIAVCVLVLLSSKRLKRCLLDQVGICRLRSRVSKSRLIGHLKLRRSVHLSVDKSR